MIRLVFITLILFSMTIAVAQTANSSISEQWEEKFRQIPNPENLKSYMKRLTERPHYLGSAFGKENAEWMRAKFEEWGLDARIETFEVLFPSPKERLVELLEPTSFKASLQEPPIEGDAASQQLDEQLPTYNAFSADGDVTGELVFVNYGIPADYEYLDRLGISVEGKIVIAKYGGSWRGIKPKVAAEHGAIGCLIYTDPQGDGYAQGDVYPKGPWRPAGSVQRGSVMDMPLYPGDVLTPGVGATGDIKRLDRSEVTTFTQIPVLPISAADAQPLLEAMEGPVAPGNWRGDLPITYHIGPGPAKVRMKIICNWEMKEIYNVIAEIRGSKYPDQWIIRGNHHDAWGNGATDPISGMVSLMEEARAMAELVKQGWQPQRTLIYCVWDAEEQGLIGSTEWVETHAAELRENAVIYINTDGSRRGYLSMSGSHILEKLINAVAKDIEDPQTGLSVWKRRQLGEIAYAGSAAERNAFRQNPELKINALGSGSDYTAFLDHLGIASLHLGFSGEGGYGVYHSVYDSYDWYLKFGDPDFVYGRALAQTTGTAVMRIANADILPYDFINFARTIDTYLNELKQLSEGMREEIIETNRQIDEGVYEAIKDPRTPSLSAPARENVPPFHNFAPLENAVSRLKKSAAQYHQNLDEFRSSGRTVPAGINKKLIQSERKLTLSEGLPARKWFKHQIYAPGFYTGYGVKTLPRIREAIEQKEWDTVDAQIEIVAGVLNGFSDLVDEIAGELAVGE